MDISSVDVSDLKEKLMPLLYKLLDYVKGKLNTATFKKMIPWAIGTFFIYAGLYPSLGRWFTSLIAPNLSYESVSWVYLFLGVDLVGSFAIPLLFIKLGWIPPFSMYGPIAQHLFQCKEITLLEVMNIRFFVPCDTQYLMFYLWLLSVVMLFFHRFPYLSRGIEFLGKITYNYFYLALMMVKVVALGTILLTTTPFSFLLSFMLAIVIILLDLFTINVAIKASKQNEQNI